ncbi:MAG: zinc-ribbon domain-containing protein [Candidatus Bathyarchaeia archaeon]
MTSIMSNPYYLLIIILAVIIGVLTVALVRRGRSAQRIVKEPIRYCANCGAALKPEETFCTSCGKRTE